MCGRITTWYAHQHYQDSPGFRGALPVLPHFSSAAPSAGHMSNLPPCRRHVSSLWCCIPGEGGDTCAQTSVIQANFATGCLKGEGCINHMHNLACHAVELSRTSSTQVANGRCRHGGSKCTPFVLPDMPKNGPSLKHNTNVIRCCGVSHLAELRSCKPAELAVLRMLYPTSVALTRSGTA